MADAVDRDGFLFHDFQEGGLRLGRSPVDFICDQDIREYRARAKLEPACLQIEDVRAQDVGRHQVRRELDALAVNAKKPRDRAGHERLGRARYALQQNVAATNEGQQDQLDVFTLADDNTLCAIE